jgi:1-deoxy-D-xylulose-5-phosphate synthase
VVNCRFVKPLDEQMLQHLAETHQMFVTVEEATLVGGFGSAINDWITDNLRTPVRLRRMGIPDNFIEHGNRDKLLELVSLHPEGIAASTLELVREEGKRSLTFKTPLPTTVAAEEEVEVSTQSER